MKKWYLQNKPQSIAYVVRGEFDSVLDAYRHIFGDRHYTKDDKQRMIDDGWELIGALSNEKEN